jgi:hypothetical protein
MAIPTSKNKIASSNYTSMGKVMMKTDVILRFTQRALWLYIVEAVIVLAIVIAIGVYA